MSDTHPCPEVECSHDCQTFGSLLSHLRSDHGVNHPVQQYGDGE